MTVGLAEKEASQLELAIGEPVVEGETFVLVVASLDGIQVRKIGRRIQKGEVQGKIMLHVIPVFGSRGIPAPPTSAHARIRAHDAPSGRLRDLSLVESRL